MTDAIDVLVIGTEPPCPRCDLLGILVKECAPANVELNLSHCAFDAEEATALGKRLGRKIGTAKHVSKDADIPMDWDAVYGLIEQQKASARPDCRPADLWTAELDALLRPCGEAAESTGYLMTPVLVVNGEVVHHGSIPSRGQIMGWLS